jgi:M6 family metalloprotease-like protein
MANPENYNLNPAPANATIGLVLVDTSTTRFTGNLAAEKQRWLDAAGALAALFAESSYGKTTIAADWLGEIHLPETWDHYMAKSGTRIFGSGLNAAVVTDLGAAFDFQKYWALVFIVEPFLDSAGTLQRIWSTGGSHLPGTPTGTPQRVAIGNTTVSFRPITISRDQGDQAAYPNSILADRVLFHEMGHTLGLNDLYAPVPTTGRYRNMAGWDPMAEEDKGPGHSLVNRLRFGWVLPASVPSYDLRVVPHLPATITLTPLELGPSPNGTLGAELRLADGWDYYLEYRKRQNGQLLDQWTWDWTTPNMLDAPERVLLTSAVIYTGSIPAPTDRPDLLLAGPDDNTTVGILKTGQQYFENALPLDLTVVSMDATKAVIQIQGGGSMGPDPSIERWNPPQTWQSPDIEVTNDRATMDPGRYANLPWAGHDNTITAFVSNSGTLDANGVVVDFFVCDFGANGPLTQVGSSAGGNVARNAQRIPFVCQSPWQPPAAAFNGGHWCVVCRIRPYQTAGGRQELSTLNNEARSNYTQFISSTASPASRVGTTFAVHNPYTAATIAYLGVLQDNAAYATFLEHRWVRLAPGELRHVGIAFQYLPDGDDTNKKPCRVSVGAAIVDPAVGNLRLLGGGTVRVLTGRATEVDRITRTTRSLRGRIVAVDNGKPVTGGNVIVSKAVRVERTNAESKLSRAGSVQVLRTVGKGRVGKDGSFAIPLAVKGRLIVDYLGATGFDDSQSTA